MSSTTPKLGLTLVDEGSSGIVAFINDVTKRLDMFGAHMAFVDKITAEPSVTEADNGKVWLIDGTGSGSNWTGHDNEIAGYYDGWFFLTPVEGMVARVLDDNVLQQFDGSVWSTI